MSHTVKVDVKFNSREAIELAASTIGATIIGEGQHRLYGSNEEGFAIKLKGWNYPVVIHKDGTIAYDNYNGHWGNIDELENLKEYYTMSASQLECQKLGWYTEFDPVKMEMTAFHPSGGTITIDRSGRIDANGFVGTSCAEATSAIEIALGQKMEQSQKPEYNQTRIAQREQE